MVQVLAACARDLGRWSPGSPARSKASGCPCGGRELQRPLQLVEGTGGFGGVLGAGAVLAGRGRMGLFW